MPIDFAPDHIVLRETVGVDDAEPLLDAALTWTHAAIDLATCTHVHPAVLQVLVATRSTVVRWPDDHHLGAWLATLLPSAPGVQPPSFTVSPS